MSNEVYEKVEIICQKIDAFTKKDFSVKNKIKTEVYTTKIKKLINMIEKAETIAQPSIIDNEEKTNVNIENNNIVEDQYNPYSENFYYKDRLKQLNGDIYRLIEELKAQDNKGFRNAYIINEIEKYTVTKTNIKVRKNRSLWKK